MTRTIIVKIALVLLLCLCLLGKESQGIQDNGPCDPELLKQASNGPLGYSPRNLRCEGRYGRTVATSTPLSLRSFVLALPNERPLSSSLRVSWMINGNKQIELRAYSLKRGEYFQMDARSSNSNHI